MKTLLYCLLTFILVACSFYNPKPYSSNHKADSLYFVALKLSQRSYDIDSSKISLSLLQKAIDIDANNPIYYNAKAKIYVELGQLDSAIALLNKAKDIDVLNGEGYFMLGTFLEAEGDVKQAKFCYTKSLKILKAILKTYPDSLGAFVLEQCSNALIQGNDSLFMRDIEAVRKRFPGRLYEVEFIKYTKPSQIVRAIKEINNTNNDYQHLVDSIAELYK